MIKNEGINEKSSKNLRLTFLFLALFIIFWNFSCTTSQHIEASKDKNSDMRWYDQEAFQSQLAEIKPLTGIYVKEKGNLIFSEHFHGFDDNSLCDIRSVTKSVLAILTVKAVESGYTSSLDDKITKYIAGNIRYLPSIHDSLTIRHLLTMTDGFDYNEGNDFYALSTSSSPSTFLLTRDLIYNPGSRFKYSSATANLLSLVLREAVGKPVTSYADSVLFTPLDIDVSWEKGADGITLGGYGLNISGPDLLKIGDLFYHGGAYGQQQIIDKNWLTTITATYHNNANPTWGAVDKTGYGMMWWTGEIAGEKVFFALGYGGQYLLLVPSLELTLVTTLLFDNDGEKADKNERAINTLFAFIIERVKAGN